MENWPLKRVLDGSYIWLWWCIQMGVLSDGFNNWNNSSANSLGLVLVIKRFFNLANRSCKFIIYSFVQQYSFIDYKGILLYLRTINYVSFISLLVIVSLYKAT